MIRSGFILGLLLGIHAYLFAEGLFPKALSPRTANYDIRVRLDTAGNRLIGVEKIVFHNQTDNAIVDLQFHTYLNAFKNTASTFFQESNREFSLIDLDDRPMEEWGWVDVLSVETKDKVDLLASAQYIQPDDDNKEDQTVLWMPLDKPLLPGDSIVLDMLFEAKLPKAMVRTGYGSNHYYLVAQWFPKLGVYEGKGDRYEVEGQWNCHQFHSSCEFFGDFGVYKVEITVPKGFKVGASGLRTHMAEDGDGYVTHWFVAEDVIDFTWTAFPDFVEVNDKWKEVDIRLLLHPAHVKDSNKYLIPIKEAMAYLHQHVGEYPYPTLTIVDPPFRTINTGGMEYPTLITGGCIYGMPDGIRTTEVLSVHEFCHQYFMQMISSNEQEEAWMDEGFTNYMEGRIMDAIYGEKHSVIDYPFFHTGNRERNRLRYTGMDNPKIAEIFRYGWEFPHGGFRDLTYSKTGTWLATLEGLVGLEVMDEILKTYFERWKFNHPCARDFIEVVNDVVRARHGDKFGEDMNWFFEQVLYRSDVCDYAVGSINVQEVGAYNGVFDTNNKKTFSSNKNNTTKNLFESKVILHRLGEVYMPVEVVVRFENGEEITETWDGIDRGKAFTYIRSSKVESVYIDPEHKIWIDINFNNNSLTKQPDTFPLWKHISEFFFWLQQIFQLGAALA